jgi:hypothetical protein
MVRRANRHCASDLGAQFFLRSILDAQLYQFDTKRHQPGNPVGAVDDQVEGIESHANTACPITGVEGTAISLSAASATTPC